MGCTLLSEGIVLLVSINKKEYSLIGFWHQGEGDVRSHKKGKYFFELLLDSLGKHGQAKNIDMQRVKNSLVPLPVWLCVASGGQIFSISCTIGVMRAVSSFGG